MGDPSNPQTQNDASLLQALQAADAAGDHETAAQIAKMLYTRPIDKAPPIAAPAAHKPSQYDPSAGGSTLRFGPWDTGIKTSQGVDRFLSGAGQSVFDTGRGIKQLFGGQTKADTDEQRRLDAQLDRTGAGLLGNVAGGVAQFALPGMGAAGLGAKLAARIGTSPGALQAAQALYRIAAPATTGAAFGATAPVGSDETRLGNTGRGAIAGELGQVAGNGIGSILRTGEDALSRGARLGADIARKYNIPLSMSQTAGKFTQLLQSTLDKLPFSGAEGRYNDQKEAFNTALGKMSGSPDADGVLDHETWDTGRRAVGQAIGNMAENHLALVTPAEITSVNNMLRQVNTKATDDTAKIVNNYARDMFGVGGNSRAIPIRNPLPGGPVMQIPGDAWKAQHTEISDHLARLDGEGDLSHYLGILKSNYLDAMEHGMTPEEFDGFQDLRKQYSNAMTIKPLAQKAPLGEGINPSLLKNRAINQGTMYGPNGKLNDIGELAQLGNGPMMSHTPDSGTAQRSLLYAAGAGMLGAGANELFGSAEGDDKHTNDLYGLSPMAAVLAGGALGRGMGSRLVARYSQARLPEMLARPVEGALSTAPAAAAVAASTNHPDADQEQEPAMPQVASNAPKSSFWDLVNEAYQKEP